VPELGFSKLTYELLAIPVSYLDRDVDILCGLSAPTVPTYQNFDRKMIVRSFKNACACSLSLNVNCSFLSISSHRRGVELDQI
jgi:hypothetical protein